MELKVDLSKSRTEWPLKLLTWRVIWSIVNPFYLLIPTKTTIASKFRVTILKLFGASIGSKCLVCQNVNVLMPWNLKLHDYVAIGHDVEVYNYSPVTIGSMTVVSQYCYLCTGTHDYMSREMPLVSHPITVGSQVWVCAGAWVLPGTTIAEGCVVGARSVIRGITRPWSVYAGNPATLIKSRIIREK